MAGLFAWAADVVGGGGSVEDEVGEEREGDGYFEFTAEQQEQIKKLDNRASALQKEIQRLRQSLPPSHISQRLPYLHADSITTQSALSLERHAHSATRLQLQIREASLQSENAAYAKALAATQQQANDKAQEAQELEACLEEMNVAEQKLRAELHQLQAQMADNENALNESQISQLDADFLSPSAEDSELDFLRKELESLRTKAITLQEELSLLQQTSSRWPSSVQREKELERRLRSLTENLMAKQAQAESLIVERDALELQVEQVNEACQHLSSGHSDYNTKRQRFNRAGVSLVEVSSGKELSSAFQQKSTAVRQRGGRGGYFQTVSSEAMDLSEERGLAGSRKYFLFRSFAFAYILGLHIIVFVVLTIVGLGKLH